MRFEDYLKDRRTRDAVERNLYIIGEAARRVSQSFRDNHSHIPWRSMIALRNVLAHEYDEIRHERLWMICTQNLDVLIRELETLGVEKPPANPI